MNTGPALDDPRVFHRTNNFSEPFPQVYVTEPPVYVTQSPIFNVKFKYKSNAFFNLSNSLIITKLQAKRDYH